MEYEYCSCNVNVNASTRATGVLVYRDWRLMIFLIVLYEKHVVLVVTSLDGLAKPKSETDPSRIRLGFVCLEVPPIFVPGFA